MGRPRKPQLSEQDRQVLDFERVWGQSPHSYTMKIQEMSIALGLTEGGYNMILAALIDDPLAAQYDPDTIAALREVRRIHRLSDTMDNISQYRVGEQTM